ncbi:MAG: hypothetical protein JST87_06395 [Bacteroidetes bacterium]|nr:hypothetical protein [Bacteroidota bacterium]
MQTQADDQSMISNEDENLSDDANASLTSQPSISGNSYNALASSGTTELGTGGNTSPNLVLPCDATITYDTTSDTRTITITYNGTNCWGNRTRTGTVTISIPKGVHWSDANATVTLNIDNLKITRKRDGKSITINGTKTFTNVSGGLLIDLATLGTITHTITGSLSITFDNGSVRTWNVSKQRVFTYENGVVLTTTGTHSDGTNTNVAEWGTNRFGINFESLITQPKVIRQDCDFRLTSGENKLIRSDNITLTITYGLDSNGNPTSCPGSGTYYFEAVWVGPNGGTYTAILPY